MNTSPSPRARVALIAGPTASGKSALAVRVAEARGGVVVNADASQVYRDLRILSARPDAADEARAPHRLFGHRDGAVACSAADWAADARAEIEAARQAGRPAILVGGTGLYLRTLLDGIAPVPVIDPAIRAAVRALPVAEAHPRLREEDPAAATRLAPADTLRVARALEVVRSTGRAIGAWQALPRVGGIGDAIDLTAIVLLPPRADLDARIAARAAAMLDGGAVEEVAALLDRGLPADAPVMRAIGVAAVARLIAGDATRAQTIEAIALDTRRYAKRQATWFRHQVPSSWMKTESCTDASEVETLLSGD